MTETNNIRIVVIAPNRPIKEDLAIEENKAKHRMARMKFIERCCSGEYIPRPLKEDNKVTDDEKRAKAKARNQRFRENNREAFNAYINAKMKEKYKNNEEYRNREKEKARMRYRRKKKHKLTLTKKLDEAGDRFSTPRTTLKFR